MKLNEQTAKMAKIQITRSSMTHEFVGFSLFHFSLRYSSLLLFAGFTFSSELLSLLLPYIFLPALYYPKVSHFIMKNGVRCPGEQKQRRVNRCTEKL